MSVIQYVGARYVPKFFEGAGGSSEWVSGVAYEPLTIVTYLNSSYTSKKQVPVGIGSPNLNPNYWVNTGNYNEQVEEYREIVDELSVEVEGIADDVETINFKTSYYVTPEEFGAVGDGVTDDTNAFRDALEGGNKTIILGAGKTYFVTDYLIVESNTIIDLNGGKIKTNYRHLFYNFDPTGVYLLYSAFGNICIKNGYIEGGSISAVHGKNILIENVTWYNCENDHIIEICACDNFIVSNNTLNGTKSTYQSSTEYINIDPCFRANFPWFTDADNRSYDGTINKNILVEGCTFLPGEGNYSRAPRAFGCHSTGDVDHNYHKNIILRDNKVYYMTDSGFNLADMDGVLVTGNYIEWVYSANRTPIYVGRIAHCKNVTIKDNTTFQSDDSNSSGYSLIVSTKGCSNLTITGFTALYAAGKYNYRAYVNAQDVPENLSFGLIDDHIFDRSETPGNVNYNTVLKPTYANRIRLIMGGIGTYNFQEHIVPAFQSRCFLVDEEFLIPYMKSDGSYQPFKIKITADGIEMPALTEINPNLRLIGLYKV